MVQSHSPREMYDRYENFSACVFIWICVRTSFLEYVLGRSEPHPNCPHTLPDPSALWEKVTSPTQLLAEERTFLIYVTPFSEPPGRHDTNRSITSQPSDQNHQSVSKQTRRFEPPAMKKECTSMLYFCIGCSSTWRHVQYYVALLTDV